jgi:hypothetical protein
MPQQPCLLCTVSYRQNEPQLLVRHDAALGKCTCDQDMPLSAGIMHSAAAAAVGAAAAVEQRRPWVLPPPAS